MRVYVVLLLVLPAVAMAEPGPAARYLLEEPVTLMDLGLERMNREVDLHSRQVEDLIRTQTEDTDFEMLASARYDDLDDLYVLSYILHQADDPETYCAVVFNRYSDADALFAIVVGWFAQHRFIASLDDPDALYNEIASRTEIRCRTLDLEGRFRPTEGETLWRDPRDAG